MKTIPANKDLIKRHTKLLKEMFKLHKKIIEATLLMERPQITIRKTKMKYGPEYHTEKIVGEK